MENLNALSAGLVQLMTVQGLSMLALGLAVGMVVGSMPGLGPGVVVALFIPLLFHLEPVPGLALLMAIQSSIFFTASITAILLNMPGAPESAPVAIDGYAMTRKGLAARALAISATSTTLSGVIGAIVVAVALPLMENAVSLFQPVSFFLLSIFALLIVSRLSGGGLVKGVIAGAFGLMLSLVGNDPVTGAERYTFGSLSLYNGISVAVPALGMFAITQAVVLFGVNRPVYASSEPLTMSTLRRELFRGIWDVLRRPRLVIQSALVGVLAGCVPGIGGFTANFMTYGLAKATYRNVGEFGSGIPEGVIAPESSSMSKEAGMLIPALALGLPGGVGIALTLAGISILGLQPGEELLTLHLPIVYAMLWAFLIAAFLQSIIGLVLAPVLSKVVNAPPSALFAVIVPLAIVGAYSATSDYSQIVLMLVIAAVGVVMRAYGYPIFVTLIAFVLGSTIESNLYLTTKTGGLAAVAYPLPAVLAVMCVLVVLSTVIGPVRRARRRALVTTQDLLKAPVHHTAQAVVDVIGLALGLAYTVIGLGYGFVSALAPVVAGIALSVACAVELITTLRQWQAQARQPLAHPPDSGLSPRQMLGLGWVCAFIIVGYLVGFSIGIPLCVLGFLLTNTRGKRHAVYSVAITVVLVLIVYLGFDVVLQSSFTGVLWQL